MTDMTYLKAIQEYSNHVRMISEAWNARNLDKLLSCLIYRPNKDCPALENFRHNAWSS